MPFKIVQTKEQNKYVLCVVPSSWEQDNFLFWPETRSEQKLVKKENSKPTPEWLKIPCIKKREFATYREADRELEIMEEASDTDADGSLYKPSTTTKPMRKLNNTRVLQPIDLNDQIPIINTVENVIITANDKHVQEENNIESLFINLPTDAEQAFTSSSSTNEFMMTNNNSPITTILEDKRSETKTSSNTTEVKLDGTYAMEIFMQLLYNQEKIMTQLATLQASVDYLMAANIKTKPVADTRMSIQPLNTKNDMDSLETKLKDENFYNKLVSELTFVCGQSGKCKGIDSCYKLVDHMFTREIFLQCNWTGSTRDVNAEKKIPLKYYSLIRNCFLDIIRKSDINFTENDAEKFFKVVIKNAKARIQNKLNSVARTSKPRTKIQAQDKNQEKPNNDDGINDNITENNVDNNVNNTDDNNFENTNDNNDAQAQGECEK